MDVILENLTNILERSGYEIGFPGSVLENMAEFVLTLRSFLT